VQLHTMTNMTQHVTRVFILQLFLLLALPSVANDLLVRQYDDYVLTHQLTACGPVPTALDPNGVYPYVSYCETANRPEPRKYRFTSSAATRAGIVLAPCLNVRSLNQTPACLRAGNKSLRFSVSQSRLRSGGQQKECQWGSKVDMLNPLPRN
jgi:hypothetical protein